MKKMKDIPPKTDKEITLAEAQIIELSKRIEFYLTEYSVEVLANKMNNDEFVVPPTSAPTHGSPNANRALSSPL